MLNALRTSITTYNYSECGEGGGFGLQEETRQQGVAAGPSVLRVVSK